jgi:DNA polymerase
MTTVILDVETRSCVDLKKVGAWRYATHPTTDIWCVGYAIDDAPAALWVPGEPVPPAIVAAAADPACEWVAHNAAFEIAIWRRIPAPRHGWPDVPPLERWRCSMAASLALALPASLAKVAAALSLPQQKADIAIVSLMAKPRRPRGDEDPAGVYWFDDAEHREALYAYCLQDVATEQELWRLIRSLIPAEQELWCVDQRINDRGFYTDGVLIENAIAITTAAERAVQDELQQITGDTITTHHVAKLLAWLAAHGCELKELQKGTLTQALRRTGLDPVVRRAIELRREAAHASANKFQALRNWRGTDGRVRHAFKFHGAATGRWSGSGPQPQNFRRETENTTAKLAAVMIGDIAQVCALGSPIEIVGDLARCAICAPPGARLLVGDFSGIESRVLAWVAGQQDKVAQWANAAERPPRRKT